MGQTDFQLFCQLTLYVLVTFWRQLEATLCIWTIVGKLAPLSYLAPKIRQSWTICKGENPSGGFHFGIFPRVPLTALGTP